MVKKRASQDKRLANSFSKALTQVLKRFNDPAWLGAHSPLAAPYFLGEQLLHHLDGDAGLITDPVTRGEILQRLVRQAADTLAEQNAEQRRLLEIRFLAPSPLSAEQILKQAVFGMSRVTYFRQQKMAIERLAQNLIQALNPALRLETPLPLETMVGRETLVKTCITALKQGQILTLTGPGGVGKTTLGIFLARSIAPQGTFWYTFRPGLNDRLSSLLFALSYFLHHQGASGLWSQLVADKGVVKEEIALNLLHHDLNSLAGAPLILCFDEVDLLRPADVEAHVQLLPFLTKLRDLVPLIFIGQKRLIETDQVFALTGLSLLHSQEMLAQSNIHLAPEQRQHLHTYTQGNPRLLQLFMALYQTLQRSGGATEEALATLSRAPSLEFLLRRIWQHLNEAEMYMLEILAVFRNDAPRDAWSDRADQAAIGQLVAWGLVRVDRQGGLKLLPTYQEAIYHHLLGIEEKEALHLEAAAIRAGYGQYTQAAYHFVAAGEPQLAVRLWYDQREQEISQGQGGAALALLCTISLKRLEKADQERLALLQAELQKLNGRYDQAQRALQAVFWRTPFLKAQAKRLEGDIAEVQGKYSQAIAAYQTGAEMIETSSSELALFHRDLGHAHLHQRAFGPAQREILKIRYEAANLEGHIHEEKGALKEAQTCYLEAIDLAEAAGYAYGQANTCNNLAHLLSRQGNFVEAGNYLQKAAQFFERTKSLYNLASVQVNMAFNYCLAGRYQAGIQAAEKALALFEQFGEPWGKAAAAQNLAEAHLSLNNLLEAERFAWQVIQEEETNTFPDGLRTLGEVRLQQKKFQDAENLIKQSITITQEGQDTFLEGYGWRALGEVYLAQNHIDQAKNAFKQAEAIFIAIEATEEVAKTKQLYDST